MKTGTLYLIKSKNPPVFQTPMQIMFTRGPRLGESFIFAIRPFNRCNLSETKRLIRFKGFTIIKTRNSSYVLSDVEENNYGQGS